MKILVFLAALLCLPGTVLAAGSIELRELSSTPQESIYTIEAQGITQEIIGISSTIQLGNGVTFKKFMPGTFWEKAGSENVQYLISPKVNEPQKIILGIASLGGTQSNGSGTIATLYLNKTNASKPIISVTDKVISGIANGQRQDYPDIPWSVAPNKLVNAGQSLSLSLALSVLLILAVYLNRYLGFKKTPKVCYNYLKTHKNKYVPTQKGHHDQKENSNQSS